MSYRREAEQANEIWQADHYRMRLWLTVILDDYSRAIVGEDVVLRYDPADMAEVRIFYQDCFVCRAVCPELSGGQVSLKEIVAACVEQR